MNEDHGVVRRELFKLRAGIEFLNAPEEGDDLRARAGIVRGEGRRARAVRDAAGVRPDDGRGVIHAVGHVRKRIHADPGRVVVVAPEEGHCLGARHGLVGGEGRGGRAVRDALADCPEHRSVVVRVGADVPEGVLCVLRRRRAGGAPEEGYHLRAGAGGVGRKGARPGAVGDLFLHGPLHRVGEVCAVRHVREAARGKGCAAEESSRQNQRQDHAENAFDLHNAAPLVLDIFRMILDREPFL